MIRNDPMPDGPSDTRKFRNTRASELGISRESGKILDFGRATGGSGAVRVGLGPIIWPVCDLWLVVNNLNFYETKSKTLKI